MLSHFSIVLRVAYRWYRPLVAGIALLSLVATSRRWYPPLRLETIESLEVLLHPLEGSITLSPVWEGDTSDGRAIPVTGG